jgi:hypothetical protein
MTIRDLNDAFRTSFAGGRVVMTAAVASLDHAAIARITAAVKATTDFSEDPHGEHDFGAVTVDERIFWWKIDYYDEALAYGSEDPTNPKKTVRVLTIMLPEDY